MDLRAEKLNLIEELIQLNDKDILKKIKSLISSASKRKIKPMSLDEFYSRIDRSEKEIDSEETTSQSDLIKEISSWGK